MNKNRFDHFFFLAVLFWILAAGSIPSLLKVQTPPAAWDVDVYHHAIDSLRSGHDPYLDGIAVQRARHAEMLQHPELMPPYTYVYSPLTLPLLGLIARLPLHAVGLVYWTIYILAMIAIPCTLLVASKPSERRVFLLLAPAAPFFPGLLQTNVFFSGNVAYLLYALVFAGALLGWKRNLWSPFYLATLLAAACKAPLLTLLLIPAFSARKQWIPVVLTAAVGLSLFAIQPLLWPSLPRHYLEAVELQFSFNHDFGVSPAGVLGNILFAFGKPYCFISTAFYLLYAAVVFFQLWRLSRRFLAGAISLQQWVPVLLLGVILLNPRIKEYDVAVIALPMALLLWRVFRFTSQRGRAIFEMSLFFIAINGIAIGFSAEVWKPLETILLVGLFGTSVWQLNHSQAAVPEPQPDLHYALH